jgi:pimeloyl-ACP methyl ester carboxylesterase
VAGGEVAEWARRDYGGERVTEEQSAAVFAAFGPAVPTAQQRARTIRNPALGEHGARLLRRLDVVDQLARIDCPTLACAGDRDPVTPVAASREIVDALPPGIGQLTVIEGAGHFPWLDRPDRYWPLISGFITRAGR